MIRIALILPAVALASICSAQSCPDWIATSAEGPSSRRGHQQAAFDSARGEVVLYGGFDGTFLGDTWVWDGEFWSLRSTEGPGPRSTTLAYDSIRNQVVLFGGSNSQVLLGDTWEWDGNAWTMVADADAGPSRRYASAMAFDQISGEMLLFGGHSGSSRLNDTWSWNGSAWTQIEVSGPDARSDHVMAYDSSRQVVILYGGDNSSGTLQDTWEWDGNQWLQVADGPFAAESMVYDNERQVCILFTQDGSTWSWDGADWQQLSVDTPGARFDCYLAYDTNRRETILYGGMNSGEYLGDTWILESCPSTVITNFEIITGSLLSGDISDLLESDDATVVTRSGFGESFVDLHKMEMIIHLKAGANNPATLDLIIESRISEPVGIAHIELRNWTTGNFEQILQHVLGTEDLIVTADGIEAGNYVSDLGEIDTMVRHLVFVPFFAFTFESYIDHIEISVAN